MNSKEQAQAQPNDRLIGWPPPQLDYPPGAGLGSAAHKNPRPEGPPITDMLARRLASLNELVEGMSERAAHVAGRLGFETHGPEPSNQPQEPGMLGTLSALLSRVDAAAHQLDSNLRELERL